VAGRAREPRRGGGARGLTGEAQLRVDVREVALHRPVAQVQACRDLVVGASLGDVRQHLELALAQFGQLIRVRPRPVRRDPRALDVIGDPEKRPLPGDTAEEVAPAVLELQAGAHHEVPDRARRQDLPCPRLGHHPRGQVHGDADQVAPQHLALAGVEADAHLKPERARALPDRQGGTHRARRRVEDGDHAVAGRLHEPPAVMPQIALDQSV